MPKRSARYRPVRKTLQYIGLGLLAIIAVAVSVALLNPARPPEDAHQRTTFAAVGDSITEGNSPDFSAGSLGDLSWAYYANNDGVRFTSGWAVGGSSSEAMATAVEPMDADVLVILAGTNDLSQGVNFDDTGAHLKAIVKTSGIDRVIVSAIPPKDDDEFGPAKYNAKLKSFADASGWTYVDSMEGIRDGPHYTEGYTADGTHPTAIAARIIGKNLRAAIIEVGKSPGDQ